MNMKERGKTKNKTDIVVEENMPRKFSSYDSSFCVCGRSLLEILNINVKAFSHYLFLLSPPVLHPLP